MKTSDIALLGLGAAALYYLWKGGSVVGTALTQAGEEIGGGVFQWLNPSAAGSASTLVARAPAGSAKSFWGIPAESVDANGYFQKDDQFYQLLVNPNQTTGVNKQVVAAPDASAFMTDPSSWGYDIESANIM